MLASIPVRTLNPIRSRRGTPRFSLFGKCSSVPLLCLVGPWLLLLMLLIKLDSPGPAIFAQPRVGRNNHRYQCYKLRTMYDDTSDPHGNRSTARDDDRVTRIGKVLR